MYVSVESKYSFLFSAIVTWSLRVVVPETVKLFENVVASDIVIAVSYTHLTLPTTPYV